MLNLKLFTANKSQRSSIVPAIVLENKKLHAVDYQEDKIDTGGSELNAPIAAEKI